MKVTEHNMTDWNLDQYEIAELMRLAKEEMKKYDGDKATQMFYGIMIGKLLIMKTSCDD